MKRRIRFLSALLLFCLLFSLVCLLSGCGSDSSSGSSKGEGKAPGDSGVHIAEDSSKGKGDGLLTEEKIIRTARLTLETTAYDTALPALKQSVVKAGGYLESASENGTGEDGNRRNAALTARIPEANLDTFLAGVPNDQVKILRSEISQNNVSASYYDLAARLETLRSEKTALDAMLKNATTTDEVLKIHERLYDVMEEIDRYETQIRLYDNRISYATVYFAVNEVKTYAPESEHFGSRVSYAFRQSWSTFASAMTSFFVALLYMLPFLLVIAVISGVILLIVFRSAKKKKAQK
ncbi:MAG: DUF4349 domain-containing protein [Eubacteriales bacterium]|nr:DUF4349 domain-containing protein [Eubacteriales bacterium]MDY2827118.1 DUF4349 domain-containing protein [Eubacteriales bacterium]